MEETIREREQALDEKGRKVLNAIRNMPDHGEIDDVLDRSVPADSGEFQQLLEDDLRSVLGQRAPTRVCEATAFFCEKKTEEPGKGIVAPQAEDVVVDVFETYEAQVPLLQGIKGTASLVLQGLIPSAPPTRLLWHSLREPSNYIAPRAYAAPISQLRRLSNPSAIFTR
ncbi:hypothetical protein DXG03_001142 [Asterophora parasitica]|uniref:Uncharacterized protein n=1 Tax=Asterophora parasitica TaxID=117018 RepID=A0A9P7GBT8_9AGAR|nr:hypothetical protein DXG03_001142 [Asterophora parasitica]